MSHRQLRRTKADWNSGTYRNCCVRSLRQATSPSLLVGAVDLEAGQVSTIWDRQKVQLHQVRAPCCANQEKSTELGRVEKGTVQSQRALVTKSNLGIFLRSDVVRLKHVANHWHMNANANHPCPCTWFSQNTIHHDTDQKRTTFEGRRQKSISDFLSKNCHT